MKYLVLLSFVLLPAIFTGCMREDSVKNERVVLLNTPESRDGYTEAIRQFLGNSDTVTFVLSTYEPSLLLIRGENLDRLDDAPDAITKQGLISLNYFTSDDSRDSSILVCRDCGVGISLFGNKMSPAAQARSELPLQILARCCPSERLSAGLSVSIVAARGEGKVSLAEMLEAVAQRVVTQKPDVVVMSPEFPLETAPLLRQFCVRMQARNSIVIATTEGRRQ